MTDAPATLTPNYTVDCDEPLCVIVDEGGLRDSGIVRRHERTTGWQPLLARALAGDSERVDSSDPRVIEILELL